MGLPLSRPRNYVNGIPAIPDDVNDLFDAVIGAKFGQVNIPIPASAFVITSGTGAIANGMWTATSALVLQAPIILPEGAMLTSLTFGYNRNSTGSVTVALGKREVASGAATSPHLVTRTATDATGAAWETAVYTGLDLSVVANLNGVADPEPIAAGFVYWLEVDLPNTGVFGGAIVGAYKP